jgi:primosomal protein N'
MSRAEYTEVTCTQCGYWLRLKRNSAECTCRVCQRRN